MLIKHFMVLMIIRGGSSSPSPPPKNKNWYPEKNNEFIGD
jgi:hypothetical protein